MPIHQAIISEDDRTFPTPSFNWQGSPIWHPEGLYDQATFIGLPFQAGDPPFTITLSYPYIEPIPGHLYTLSLRTAALPQDAETCDYYITLTDGVTNFTYYGSRGGPPPNWYLEEILCDLPPSWTTINTTLIISLTNLPAGYIELTITDISLTTPLPIHQLLPLMGIG